MYKGFSLLAENFGLETFRGVAHVKYRLFKLFQSPRGEFWFRNL